MEKAHLEIAELRDQLYTRTSRGEHFPNLKPLISHYCSTSTLEAILRYEQIWFSNPLLMNDLEELSFGMLTSRERLRSRKGLKNVLGSTHHYDAFKNLLENFFDGFEQAGAFDVYIACFAVVSR